MSLEKIVISGSLREQVDNVLVRSQYNIIKVFPTWDLENKGGYLIYEFSILYPEERELLQTNSNVVYFSRQLDLENWFNG